MPLFYIKITHIVPGRNNFHIRTRPVVCYSLHIQRDAEKKELFDVTLPGDNNNKLRKLRVSTFQSYARTSAEERKNIIKLQNDGCNNFRYGSPSSVLISTPSLIRLTAVKMFEMIPVFLFVHSLLLLMSCSDHLHEFETIEYNGINFILR